MKKILIIGSSKQPVPAVKGGAVPALVEELVEENEKQGKIELTCLSIYDQEAEQESYKYGNTKFVWAKVPSFVKKLDKIPYLVSKYILGGKRIHSLSFLFEITWFIFFVSKTIKEHDYDKVVIENSIPLLYALKLHGNRKKYKGKWYLHMHTVPRGYRGIRSLLNESKKIIVVSNYVKGKIREATNLADEKFSIMYNCLNNNFFTELDERKLMSLRRELLPNGIGGGIDVLLFVGRLNKEKGIEIVFEALRQMKDCILLVVGSNFYKTNIVSKYEVHLREITQDIKEKVIFTGYIDNKDMPYVYALSDVVILPSVWEEPAGMTMLEAMACSKPLITTYSGGIPEYVGENGCVMLEKDAHIAENLTKSIEMLLKDKDYRSQISRQGRKNVVHLNQKYYYEQFIDLLEED